MRFLDYKVLSPITCTPLNLVLSKYTHSYDRRGVQCQPESCSWRSWRCPSSRSLQQKKKNTLPFHFHSLFVRAQPKEEEEEAKDVDCGGGGGKRKKLRLSTEQLNLLEESFRAHTTLAPDQKQELAQRLQLQPRQVEVWFQNRRARTKLKQTEVDCEFLKKCCERLTHENRRLKTELTELRSLKPGSQFHVEVRKAARLRVCSSCEKMVSVEEKSKNRALS